jgi:hypothetical protein
MFAIGLLFGLALLAAGAGMVRAVRAERALRDVGVRVFRAAQAAGFGPAEEWREEALRQLMAALSALRPFMPSGRPAPAERTEGGRVPNAS